MSVSKIRHETIMLNVDAVPSSQSTIKDGDAHITPNPGEFWTEFNRTLDDFFSTISSSRQHIQQLNTRLAEQDRRVQLLVAENIALRDQLATQRASANLSVRPTASPSNGHSQRPTPAPEAAQGGSNSAARRSIWSRLSGLDPDPTPHDDRNF